MSVLVGDCAGSAPVYFHLSGVLALDEAQPTWQEIFGFTLVRSGRSDNGPRGSYADKAAMPLPRRVGNCRDAC